MTDDQTEALAISDVIGVMNAGRLVEYGTPGEIYDRPRSRFAAEFIGAADVVLLSDLRSEGDKTRARTPWGEIYFLSDGLSNAAVDCRFARKIFNLWQTAKEKIFGRLDWNR